MVIKLNSSLFFDKIHEFISSVIIVSFELPLDVPFWYFSLHFVIIKGGGHYSPI